MDQRDKGYMVTTIDLPKYGSMPIREDAYRGYLECFCTHIEYIDHDGMYIDIYKDDETYEIFCTIEIYDNDD